ncbi:hypothetical protein LY78DRAFT_80588 [Colletotrichum sublineola]|nr:hypothetical protein LY78DRAFT_80588 [Colletotrichum sublineola]
MVGHHQVELHFVSCYPGCLAFQFVATLKLKKSLSLILQKLMSSFCMVGMTSVILPLAEWRCLHE